MARGRQRLHLQLAFGAKAQFYSDYDSLPIDSGHFVAGGRQGHFWLTFGAKAKPRFISPFRSFS